MGRKPLQLINRRRVQRWDVTLAARELTDVVVPELRTSLRLIS
ncbi:hypothetical protein SALBM311S_08076 [Streptomyces alboniger]